MQPPLVLAIDLGGTSVRAALVEPSGTIVARTRTRTDATGGPHKVVAQIAALADEMRAAAGDRPLHGMGVASPGPLDPFEGVVYELPTFKGWRDVPLRRMLADATGLDVVLENDAASAVFGEWRYGAGKGTDNVVYVTVSTGVGGGAIVDGRLMHGRKGLAAHVGHMTIDPDGPRCGCGNPGCLEAFASGTSLARFANAAVADGGGGMLAALDGRPATAEDVVQAARAGDPLALRLLADEARYLGIGVVSIFHVFSPDIVILGGGVMAAYDLLLPGIEAQVALRAMTPFKNVPVHKAALGGEAGTVGIAALAFQAAGIELP